MKLEHLTDLRLTVDPDVYLASARSKATLWHLLDRLFMGEEVAESEFTSWGLTVKVVDEFVRIPRAE